MLWIKLISWYFIIGVVNTMIIDYAHYKMIQRGSEERPFNNIEKSLILFFWPIYSCVFWVSFFYNFFKSKK
jgi:hypothetical protein